MHRFDSIIDSDVGLYKKKLLTIVIGISIVTLLVILERIFFDLIIEGETSLLESI